MIKQATDIKFLGVLIDHHLSWKPHINLVSKTISKSIAIIAKARFYLSSKTLLSLYYSHVFPYLTYSKGAWSSTYSLISSVLILFPSPFSCIRITTIFLPFTFQCFFTTGEQFHQHNTRTASQYGSHFCKTNVTKFSILYQGPKVWNSLPVTIVSPSFISI